MSKSETKRLLIVDHHALLHRCRNALLRTGRKYTTSKGIPTTGVFSYLNALLSIIDNTECSHVVICFDAGSNARKTESDTYKANRGPLGPDFIAENRILLNEAFYALGIESVGVRGYEADDLIGTFAHIAQFGIQQFEEVVIATVDQDLLQCVTERTKVLLWNSIKKQQLMGVDEVLEKWECYPDQITLIKALAGDSSDNIQGVKGIGRKTAVKICNEAKWLLGDILSHPKVLEHSDRVKENLELVHLRNCTGVIGPICWDDYVIGLGVREDWERFLSKYELSSLAKRIDKTSEMMQLRG